MKETEEGQGYSEQKALNKTAMICYTAISIVLMI